MQGNIQLIWNCKLISPEAVQWQAYLWLVEARITARIFFFKGTFCFNNNVKRLLKRHRQLWSFFLTSYFMTALICFCSKTHAFYYIYAILHFRTPKTETFGNATSFVSVWEFQDWVLLASHRSRESLDRMTETDGVLIVSLCPAFSRVHCTWTAAHSNRPRLLLNRC